MTTPNLTTATLVSSEDIDRWGRKVVLVAFEVEGLSARDAERVVANRLNGAGLLGQNDSTDYQRGSADPIRTFDVVPLVQILEDSL